MLDLAALFKNPELFQGDPVKKKQGGAGRTKKEKVIDPTLLDDIRRILKSFMHGITMLDLRKELGTHLVENVKATNLAIEQLEKDRRNKALHGRWKSLAKSADKTPRVLETKDRYSKDTIIWHAQVLKEYGEVHISGSDSFLQPIT